MKPIGNHFEIHRSGGFVEIRGLKVGESDFYGPCAQSPNGRYLLAWRDAHTEENGPGRYALFDQDRLVATGELQRPNFGVVANNGTFTIQDWLCSTQSGGVFYVIGCAGDALVEHRVRANILVSGISDDGMWAACGTGGGPDPDGSKLLFFDVAAGALVWKVEPVCPMPNGFVFDTIARELFLHIQDGEGFRYSFDGVFVDTAAWREYEVGRALNDGYGYNLLEIAGNRLAEWESADFSCEDIVEVAAWIEAAAKKYASPIMVAGTYRALGEAVEARGWRNDAIRFYRLALENDPRVGVKRRLEKLVDDS